MAHISCIVIWSLHCHIIPPQDHKLPLQWSAWVALWTRASCWVCQPTLPSRVVPHTAHTPQQEHFRTLPRYHARSVHDAPALPSWHDGILDTHGSYLLPPLQIGLCCRSRAI